MPRRTDYLRTPRNTATHARWTTDIKITGRFPSESTLRVSLSPQGKKCTRNSAYASWKLNPTQQAAYHVNRIICMGHPQGYASHPCVCLMHTIQHAGLDSQSRGLGSLSVQSMDFNNRRRVVPRGASDVASPMSLGSALCGWLENVSEGTHLGSTR